MRGKEYNAVVYSEYSGDTVFDEQDRCLMDKAVDDFWKKLERRNEEDIKRVSAINPNLLRKKSPRYGFDYFLPRVKPKMSVANGYGNWLEFKNYNYKGEEKLLKIIVKNKETGKQNCIDIPKERENDSDIKALKVGMTVYYLEKTDFSLELVEIVKIVDDKPKAKGVAFDYINPKPFTWNPWAYVTKRAGRATFARNYLDDVIQQNEERKGRKEYKEKPYFLVRLDPIKGQSDSEENLEKIKFPCWCIWKHSDADKHHMGMLVTGFPRNELEYQLIDVGHQSGINDCCSVDRNPNLEELIKRWNIGVVKGQTQLWKLGQFDV